jgi:hypothetical protein
MTALPYGSGKTRAAWPPVPRSSESRLLSGGLARLVETDFVGVWQPKRAAKSPTTRRFDFLGRIVHPFFWVGWTVRMELFGH